MLKTTLETMQSNRRGKVEARLTCKHCHRVFVLETRFLQHQCAQMKRQEEFQTPTGQTAWHYYQLWMRSLKRLPPPANTFLTSRYFRTFINFTLFTRKVELPRVEKFIWLMAIKDYPPTIWTNDEVYSIYLEYLDTKATPIEQASLSIQTLIKYTDTASVQMQDAFAHMGIQEIIHLLHVRKLSPWLLLFSKTFKHQLVTQASAEQQIILENLIRPDYWVDQFEKYPEDISTIKMLVTEMGI